MTGGGTLVELSSTVIGIAWGCACAEVAGSTKLSPTRKPTPMIPRFKSLAMDLFPSAAEVYRNSGFGIKIDVGPGQPVLPNIGTQTMAL